MTTVTLLYFDGCPHWEVADERLRTLADERDVDVAYEVIDTVEAAEQRGFRGSPTILVDGIDVFRTGDEPFGLACRRYETPDGPAGSPTLEQLRTAVR